MSERNSRGTRHLFGGTGFYIALFLAATALAVAGYWTLLNPSAPQAEKGGGTDAPIVLTPPVRTETAEQTPEPDPAPEPAAPEADAAPADAPAELSVPTQAAEPVKPVIPASSPAPRASDPAAAPSLIVSPLSGETIAVFSVEYPVFNATLGDWRTHDGVDIAAPAGTQVLAACAGTVKEVCSDDLMGTTVVLAHDGGYETLYANLQTTPAVVETQYVTAGQVLGAVGTTALIESGSAPHLHFAVTKDGESVDPDVFLRSRG